MFDFWNFYKGLLKRIDYFDNYWDKFPKGRLFLFKPETLSLLMDNFKNRDAKSLPHTLAIIYNDGADSDYTEVLLSLLDEKWHTSEEDIVGVLEMIKDPRSIEKLYETIVNIPDYDDMRALAKKCMWVLSTINTPESIDKLKLLQNNSDPIISENAKFQFEQLVNRN